MTALGEQLALFDPPAPPASEPVTHLRNLPESYARVATNGHPWEWIVSVDHVIRGAGFVKTKEEAETMIGRTLDRIAAEREQQD